MTIGFNHHGKPSEPQGVGVTKLVQQTGVKLARLDAVMSSFPGNHQKEWPVWIQANDQKLLLTFNWNKQIPANIPVAIDKALAVQDHFQRLCDVDSLMPDNEPRDMDWANPAWIRFYLELIAEMRPLAKHRLIVSPATHGHSNWTLATQPNEAQELSYQRGAARHALNEGRAVLETCDVVNFHGYARVDPGRRYPDAALDLAGPVVNILSVLGKSIWQCENGTSQAVVGPIPHDRRFRHVLEGAECLESAGIERVYVYASWDGKPADKTAGYVGQDGALLISNPV